MTKRQFSFLTLLVLAFIVAACSLPDRIPDLRRIKIPIPDVLKPRPTVTYTLQPGAPDITQVVVTKVPDQAQLPASTVVQEPTGVVAIQAAVVGDQVIYQDELAEGWSNWSWDATTDPESTDPVYSGSAAFSAEINKGWAAVFLHTDNPISTSRYTAVHFWIHGGSQGGQSIAFKVIDGYNKNWENLAVLTLTAGEWTEVTIPLERLGSPEDMGGLVWQENTGAAASTFSIDGVTLVARTGMLTTPLSPIAGPALIIDAQAAMRPISPYIYGMNFADKELAAELRLPVRRWGGNATTLYNYQLDVHNTGSDWYFENIPEENPNPELLPDGSSVDRTIDQDLQTGTKSLITIPLIGWTPKRRVDAHPYDCSYKVSKYGAQESVDTWDTDCGNGKDAQGNNLTGNDPNDAYQPITPEFIQDWVKHLVQKYGSAEEGGVLFYNLDNEPMLWPYTHRDVHPEITTYDEVRHRTFV